MCGERGDLGPGLSTVSELQGRGGLARLKRRAPLHSVREPGKWGARRFSVLWESWGTWPRLPAGKHSFSTLVF